jgi:endonuclease/exonuclease/phosphatase family metal-dependent hydrolase
MTWNIHHAEGLDRKVDVDRIAKLILSEKPDVVALQEVDRRVERTNKIDIITRLADLTDMTYAFGKTIDFQGGEYGNAFLTRFPILEEHNLHYTMIRPGERRGLLQLVLETKGEEVVVATTHFDSQKDDSARAASAKELPEALTQFSPRPVIVCGDFNDTPSSATITGLKQFFSDAWEQSATGDGFTYPSNLPKKRIDYVFVMKNRGSDSTSATIYLRPVAARVLQTTASDHLPVVVDFEVTTER